MPLRVAGNAARLEVGLLVTDRAAHGGQAMSVRAALDWRLVRPALGLTRVIASRMAVDATRMGQHPAQLGEDRCRPFGCIDDRRKALRCREAFRLAVSRGLDDQPA